MECFFRDFIALQLKNQYNNNKLFRSGKDRRKGNDTMDRKIKSMTGYGKGEFIANDRRFTVEMKSVNHRYNDISIKMPRSLISLEDAVKKRIMADVFRGKTDVYINYETFSKDDVEVRLNTVLADAYLEKLHELSQTFALEEKDVFGLTARFPDVITVEKAQSEESIIWETLLPALEEAITRFVQMRCTEGENLKQDILQKRESIISLVAQIKERAPLVVQEYKEKLENRLQELLGNVQIDPQRVAMEVAVFADKGCIDEEITRLESHLTQLQEILQEGGQVGRKLDFLVQEMNRETNTIASKANDIKIVQTTIALKSEIEKIREQIQNLE